MEGEPINLSKTNKTIRKMKVTLEATEIIKVKTRNIQVRLEKLLQKSEKVEIKIIFLKMIN